MNHQKTPLTFNQFFSLMNKNNDVGQDDNLEIGSLGKAIGDALNGSINIDFTTELQQTVPTNYGEFEADLTKVLNDSRPLSVDFDDSFHQDVDYEINDNEQIVPDKTFSLTSNETFIINKSIPNSDHHVIEPENLSKNVDNNNTVTKQQEKIKKTSRKIPTMLAPCDCKIKNCSTNVGEEIRQEIHDQYWSMESGQQKMWDNNHVTFTEPNRRYSNGKNESRRKFTRIFFLPINGSKVEVCQKMFLSTLGFKTDKRIRTLHNSIDNTGFVRESERGKHPPKHKLFEEDFKFIKDHIRKFNPCVSHYRREHAPNRFYLPSELDVNDMYNDYVICAEEKGGKKVSYVTYWRHVKNMNISFAKLGVEECEVCDTFKIHVGSLTNREDDDGDLVRKKSKTFNTPSAPCRPECENCKTYFAHVEKKDLALSMYQLDKENAITDKETVYLSCDLQKVILLPRLPGYKKCLFTSRLIAFNMTFAPIGKRGRSHDLKPVGVLWHEEISGRKDENISSAFNRVFSFAKFRDFSNWVLWADNCGGQNKCWTLFTMLATIINSPENSLNSITIKYLCAGHTFMSADNFHRSVERAMKKMDKVYDFEDFVCCVGSHGDTISMKANDFFLWENGLSQSKISKSSG